jgi:ATP-dependent DNA helicase 2 subunit 2
MRSECTLQKEKGRRFWQEGLEDGDKAGNIEPGEDPLQIEDQKPLSLEFLSNKKVENVGSVNPVEDFEAMVARRDSGEWIPKAINGMMKIVSDLLSSAYNGNTYDKAVACLVALRSGCVIHEVSLSYAYI